MITWVYQKKKVESTVDKRLANGTLYQYLSTPAPVTRPSSPYVAFIKALLSSLVNSVILHIRQVVGQMIWVLLKRARLHHTCKFPLQLHMLNKELIPKLLCTYIYLNYTKTWELTHMFLKIQPSSIPPPPFPFFNTGLPIGFPSDLAYGWYDWLPSWRHW